jgi:hypothetical protein
MMPQFFGQDLDRPNDRIKRLKKIRRRVFGCLGGCGNSVRIALAKGKIFLQGVIFFLTGFFLSFTL